MTEEYKNYQLICLFSPLLEEPAIEKISQKIKDSADREISSNLIKKRLAYPIKKYQEAFQLTLNFSAAGQNIRQISQQLNLEGDVLRYLILKQAPIKEKPVKEKAKTKLAAKLSEKIEPLVAQEIPLKEEKEKGKFKIEELDKKLEEILNK